MNRCILIAIGMALGLAASSVPCASQTPTTYPTKPITLVVPFPPGGGTDTIGRPLASVAQQHLGQPMVVINKGGGGGAVGSQFAANAKPDGYTVLYAINNLSEIPQIDELLGRPVAFRKEQFIPIGQITVSPFAIMVHTESRFKSFKDFVEEARQNPDKLQYASAGVYSPNSHHVGAHTQGHREPRPPPADDGRGSRHDGGARPACRHRPLRGAGGLRDTIRSQEDPAARRDLGEARPEPPRRADAEGARLRRELRDLARPDGTSRDTTGDRGQAAPWTKAMVEDEAFKGLIGKLGERVQYMSGEDFEKWWTDDYKKVGALLKDIIKK